VWRIEWSHEALRELYKLEKVIAERIVKKLDQAAKNPARFFERLVGEDDYKLRITDYRVRAELNFQRETVYILKVGHRKNIYKK
jgi:mRNA interferase RelE/StbE